MYQDVLYSVENSIKNVLLILKGLTDDKLSGITDQMTLSEVKKKLSD